MKGWRGRGQYDKNEEKEFHYSMENVRRESEDPDAVTGIQHSSMGKAGGEGLNKILFYESYFNIFLCH